MSRFTRTTDSAPTALSRSGFLITTGGGGLAFSFLTACGAKHAPGDVTTIDAEL